MSECNLADRFHRRGLTIKMDRDNGTRSRRYGILDPAGIQIIRLEIRFDRNRHSTGIRDRQPGGDVGVSRNNNFAIEADFITAQDQDERVQSVSDTYAMLGSTIGCELRLERFDFLAQD